MGKKVNLVISKISYLALKIPQISQIQQDLDPLFLPRTVAVIGASTDPRKFGGLPINYMKTRGFSGRLIPVNPHVDFVQGIPSVSSIADIPGPIDCAIISIPAASAEAAIYSCVNAGVRVAVMFSAGYAELGKKGVAAQKRLVEIAHAGGMRILGPNCMGVFNRSKEFYGTFTSSFEHYGGHGFPLSGTTAIVSQSGAIGIHLMVLLRDRGVGIGKWVTTGNQSDIDVADCISWLVQDEQTSAIVLYLEGLPEGRKFVEALNSADQAGKPVILLKAGTSKLGARATLSHTASLAGQDEVFDGVVRQSGAIRARSLEDLADITAAFAPNIMPGSENFGAVTISGGAGALIADVADQVGLKMPDLNPKQKQQLLSIVPFASPLNPMDTAGPGMMDMDIPLNFMDIALASGRYDSMTLFMTHLGLIDRHWEPLSVGLIARAKKYPHILIALSATATRDRRVEMAAAGIPMYVEPTAAVRSLGLVCNFYQRQRRQLRS